MLQEFEIFQEKVISPRAIGQQSSVHLAGFCHQVGFLAGTGWGGGIANDDKLTREYNAACDMGVEDIELVL
ncbi:hypothetical protein D3C84_1235170 [compost metagenome]